MKWRHVLLVIASSPCNNLLGMCMKFILSPPFSAIKHQFFPSCTVPPPVNARKLWTSLIVLFSLSHSPRLRYITILQWVTFSINTVCIASGATAKPYSLTSLNQQSFSRLHQEITFTTHFTLCLCYSTWITTIYLLTIPPVIVKTAWIPCDYEGWPVIRSSLMLHLLSQQVHLKKHPSLRNESHSKKVPKSIESEEKKTMKQLRSHEQNLRKKWMKHKNK